MSYIEHKVVLLPAPLSAETTELAIIDGVTFVNAAKHEAVVDRHVANYQGAVSDATALARELHRFRCKPGEPFPCAVCRELFTRIGITTVRGQS